MLSAKEIAEEHADAFEDWWRAHKPQINEAFSLNGLRDLCQLAFQEGIFMALGDEDRE